MKKFLLPVLIFTACNSSETKTGETSTDTVQETIKDTITGNTGYLYKITNKATGEVKEISQEEYLSSDYIDNPDYAVEEMIIVK